MENIVLLRPVGTVLLGCAPSHLAHLSAGWFLMVREGTGHGAPFPGSLFLQI
jgi:hypothetical protein